MCRKDSNQHSFSTCKLSKFQLSQTKEGEISKKRRNLSDTGWREGLYVLHGETTKGTAEIQRGSNPATNIGVLFHFHAVRLLITGTRCRLTNDSLYITEERE